MTATDAPNPPASRRILSPLSWAILLIASTAIYLVRSLSIARYQLPPVDHFWFLDRGLAFWSRTLGNRYVDNPAAGCGVSALPVVIARLLGAQWDDLQNYQLITAWRAFLSVAIVAPAALWAGRLYGGMAAVFAAGLIVFDPTFAAHVPLDTAEGLVTAAAILSGLAAQRWARERSWNASFLCVAAVAFTLNMKLNAVALPFFCLAAIGARWLVDARDGLAGKRELRKLFLQIIAAVPVGLLCIWVITEFDISPVLFPVDHIPKQLEGGRIASLLSQSWPGGTFFRSLLCAYQRSMPGHTEAFILGTVKPRGSFFYLPIAGALKLPIGSLVLIVLVAITAFWRALVKMPREREGGEAQATIRWPELELLVMTLAWTIFLSLSPHQLGIRHFMPAVALWFIVLARVVAKPVFAGQRVIAFVLLACIAGQSLLSHPNEISFINAPWRHPEKIINESNLDWGQSSLLVGEWARAHPEAPRPIYYAYVNPDISNVREMDRDAAGPEVIFIEAGQIPADRRGTLLTSPWWLWLKTAEGTVPYPFLQKAEPFAMIAGHSVYAFDVSKMAVPEGTPAVSTDALDLNKKPTTRSTFTKPMQ